jgi:hypothetical protein
VVSALVSGGVAVLRTPPPTRKQRALDPVTAAEEAAQLAAAKRRAALVRWLTHACRDARASLAQPPPFAGGPACTGCRLSRQCGRCGGCCGRFQRTRRHVGATPFTRNTLVHALPVAAR